MGKDEEILDDSQLKEDTESVNRKKKYDLFTKLYASRVNKGEEFVEAFGSSVERICAIFGGIDNFVAALKCVGIDITASAVYRWRAPIDGKGGADGNIPPRYIHKVEEAARLHGILLPNDAFLPIVKPFIKRAKQKVILIKKVRKGL